MLTRHYFSYLIRVWRGDNPLVDEWLASLEDPTTNQIIYFKTLEELFAFLQKKASVDQHHNFSPLDH